MSNFNLHNLPECSTLFMTNFENEFYRFSDVAKGFLSGIALTDRSREFDACDRIPPPLLLMQHDCELHD